MELKKQYVITWKASCCEHLYSANDYNIVFIREATGQS